MPMFIKLVSVITYHKESSYIKSHDSIIVRSCNFYFLFYNLDVYKANATTSGFFL